MRRRYGVICSFFIGFLALSLMCYATYRYAEENGDVERENDSVTRESTQTGIKKEQTVSRTTKYVIEKYNRETKEMTKEEPTIPPQYIGMNRSQLEDHLVEELATMSKTEEQNGLINITLKSFSGEQIVVRNIYSVKKQEGFLLKLLDGEVAIYSRDGSEFYEKTGIQEENLTEEDSKSLRKGIAIQNEKELYSILENFSS